METDKGVHRVHPPQRTALAMCVYNGARYLQEQLDSITRQTKLLDQIVIVDDNSNDDSWDLLQAWKARCGLNVLLVRNDRNLGVVRNFEKAALLVDADIVFFSDQDDIWYPDKVARMMRVFDDPQVVLAHSDADLINEDGTKLGRRLFESLLMRDDERELVRTGSAAAVYLKRNLVTGAACAARLELVRRALPFPMGWIHDEWLALAAGVTGAVVMLEDPTISYRLHGSNTVGLPIPDLHWRLRSIGHAVFYPQRKKLQKCQARLHILQQRSAAWQAPAWFQKEINSALEHLEFRLTLPTNPLRRIHPVLHEWRSGRYNAWSNGELSVVHDILLAH